MPNLETNPDWKQLQQAVVGDIVHLKLTDGFQYLVKVIVTSIENDEIIGNVETMFDYQTKALLTGGDVLQLIGKQASFMPHFMQNVIKKY